MTQIIIKKTENGIYKGFSCDGHSGFAKYGKDIVCAAISILVINTINSLEELALEDMNVEMDADSGFISCLFKKEPSNQGKLLMDAMILGLSSVKTQYGKKYLIIKFEEV